MKLLNTYGLQPKDLKKLYFKDEKISLDTRDTFADMKGDFDFVEGIHRAIEIQLESSSAPTYLYKFSYDDELTLMKSLLPFAIKG